MSLAIAGLALLCGILQGAEPKTAQAWFQEGLQAVKSQQLEVAADSFRQVLKLDPGMRAARKNLATVLWFLNRQDESEHEFRDLLKVAPEDPVPHLYLGLAAFNRHEFQTAAAHFDKAGALALDNPETHSVVLRAYLGAADEYDRKNQPYQAVNLFKRALKLDPDSDQAYVSFAAFSSAHGNNGFALDILNSGLIRKPGSAPLLLERGIVQALQGNFDAAEQSFSESVRADAKVNLAPLALGVTQLQLGRTTAAAETFHNVTVQWPREARGYYLYALALDKTGDQAHRQELIHSLQTAIRLDAKDANSHALLGRVLWKLGNQAEAVRELETAVKLDPNHQTALYQLATAYRTLGRTDEATRTLAQFKRASARSRQEETELLQILKTVQRDTKSQ